MTRTSIPEAIKRTVRQECGFGCVLCGCPIYDYDHIEEYSRVQKHETDNLALLCTECHRQKTNKRLPVSRVQDARKEPFNLKHGKTTCNNIIAFERFIKTAKIKFGTNYCTYDFSYGTFLSALCIDNNHLVQFKSIDGEFFINIKAYDTNNKEVLSIMNNVMCHSTDIFDVKYEGTILTVKEAKQRTILSVNFDTSGTIEILKMDMKYNNHSVYINKDDLLLNNKNYMFSRCTFENCPIAIAIG